MKQHYLNRPSVGGSVPAEEFAAGTCPPPPPGCGCGPAPMPPDCGCGPAPLPPVPDGPEGPYCQPMFCCCRPAPMPAPKPPQVEEGCCCKQSFRAALSLLCDPQVSSLLDFDTSAFLTDTYSAGTVLTALTPPTEEGGGDGGDGGGTRAVAPASAPADNLGVPTGSFRRFAPCSCDLLDINADLYTAAGAAVGFTANQVNLCELDAVVIQGAAATAEGDLTAEEVSARNFRRIQAHLVQRMNPLGAPCGQTACSCACDGRDCCCAAGLLSTLAQNNLSRRVSLTAGLLVVRNVMLLGAVGNVLVLANEANNRLYFVCVNSVQFIG